MHLKKRILFPAICLIFLVFSAVCLFSATRKTDSLGQPYRPKKDCLITQYADATGQQGTCYTIENDGKLLILDGGWAGNAAFLRSVIAAHNNTVDAWIISHPHQDHAGAFNEIYQNPDGIVIKEIYDNGFDFDFVEQSGEPYDDLSIMETFHSLTADADNVIHLKRGEERTICGLTVSVYNAFDDSVLANVGGEKDYQNNASLLLKVTNNTKSILFCSDIKYDMEAYLSDELKTEIRSCRYVQVGHHGNWSFGEDFYLSTGADVFFFDAPPAITDSADFPASSLKASLLEQKKTVLDFRTAPNSVVLK